MNGTYDGENINITNSDSYTFDWESTEYPVCAVIVKAGTGANVYYYPEGTYEDTGLYAYDEKEISHVTFCFGEEDDPGEPQEEIPEFPTVALPIAAILGLAFLFQRRKE